MRIIAFMNQKGGVGKTTTAVNLGACLAEMGKRVLLVDMDPQANLSVHLDLDGGGEERSIYHVLTGRLPLGEAIRETTLEGLHAIPSHIDLSGAEIELVQAMGRETILRDALQAHLQNGGATYDHMLIDCPPSLGLLSVNAMATAQEVVVPLQMEFFALRGMSKLLQIIRLVQSRINPELQLTGIVPCMYDPRKRLCRDVLAEVKNHFHDRVYETRIRSNVRIAEAPSHGRTIVEYDDACNGAEDYRALAREVLARAGELPPEEERAGDAGAAPAANLPADEAREIDPAPGSAGEADVEAGKGERAEGEAESQRGSPEVSTGDSPSVVSSPAPPPAVRGRGDGAQTGGAVPWAT